MTYEDFRQKTLRLIKEKNLYDHIIKNNYNFSDTDLIKIAYDLSETYEKRMMLMNEATILFNGRAAEFARHIIQDMKKIEDIFYEKSDECVYELHITDKPGAYTERYLCNSMPSALKTLKWFCKHYDITLDEKSEISVYKRRIITEDAEPDEDIVAEVYLDHKINAVSYYAQDLSIGRVPEEECINECNNCTAESLCDNVKYPRIINDRDIVQFRQKFNDDGYGIVMCCFGSKTVQDYYVIRIHKDVFSGDTLYDPWDDHVHISPTDITKISKEELPSSLIDIYEKIDDLLN